jgi:tetratricopeptide (TPR) repeat protein
MFLRSIIKGLSCSIKRFQYTSLSENSLRTTTPYEKMVESLNYGTYNLTQTNEVLAEQNFKQALEIAYEIYPNRPMTVCKIVQDISNLYNALNKHLIAINYLKQGLELMKTDEKSYSAEILKLSYAIGYNYILVQDFYNSDQYLSASVPFLDFQDLESKALAYEELGRVKLRLGYREEALNYCEQATDILKSHDPNSLLLGRFYNTLGICYEAFEDYQASKNYFFKALENLDRFEDKESFSWKIDTYECLGIINLKLGHVDEALNVFIKAGNLIETEHGKKQKLEFLQKSCARINEIKLVDPLVAIMVESAFEVYGNTKETIDIFNIAAECFLTNNKLEEALKYAEKSLNIINQLNDINALMSCYLLISRIYLSLGDEERSKTYIDLCQNLLVTNYNKDIQTDLYYHLYLFYFRLEEDIEAEKYLRMHVENLPEDEEKAVFLTTRYTELGGLYQILSKLDKALACYKKGLEISEKYFKDNKSDQLSFMELIGVVYSLQKNYEKALEYLFNTLDIKLETVGEDDQTMIATYYQIASTYFRMKDYLFALEYAEKVPPLIKTHAGKTSDLGHTYVMIAEIHEKLLNPAKAKTMYYHAREVFSENQDQDQIDLIDKKMSELEL